MRLLSLMALVEFRIVYSISDSQNSMVDIKIYHLAISRKWMNQPDQLDFLAATKQLYKWYFPSVRLSVCLSHLFHHVPIIVSSWNFKELLPWSNVHAKGQGQRSKVKVTEVNTQLSLFRTLTPVWIHIWQWNHANSWKQHRRGALLFFKVIRQISRSHGSKNRRIWPRLGVSGL